jgi:phosphonate transport system substrate-binding protein
VAFLFGPNNIEPAKCFKTVTTADAEANLAGVVNGTLDVVALDTALLQRLADAGRPEPSKVTAIWASPPLPEDPILWRKDLDPELKEKLRQFFITDARGDTVLAKQQRDDLTPLAVGGFEAADDSHLLQAREIEARVRWAEAQWSGDAARIEASRKALDAILAERQAVQLAPSGP